MSELVDTAKRFAVLGLAVIAIIVLAKTGGSRLPNGGVLGSVKTLLINL